MMSSVPGRVTGSTGGSAPSIMRSSSARMRCAALSASMPTVVNGTIWNSASGTSSNPTTETSPGISRPASWNARRIPIAI